MISTPLLSPIAVGADPNLAAPSILALDASEQETRAKDRYIRRVCFHEAGHAVIGHHFGFDIEYVIANKDAGYIQFHKLRTSPYLAAQLFLAGRAGSAFSGCSSELVHKECEGDTEDFDLVLRKLGIERGREYHLAKAGFYLDVKHLFRGILRDALFAVAEALIECEYLEGSEVNAIIEIANTFGYRPRWTLTPIKFHTIFKSHIQENK